MGTECVNTSKHVSDKLLFKPPISVNRGCEYVTDDNFFPDNHFCTEPGLLLRKDLTKKRNFEKLCWSALLYLKLFKIYFSCNLKVIKFFRYKTNSQKIQHTTHMCRKHVKEVHLISSRATQYVFVCSADRSCYPITYEKCNFRGFIFLVEIDSPASRCFGQ